MPDFYPEDMYIGPSEYLAECSRHEIKELIECLVEDNHLPKSVLIQTSDKKDYSRLQSEFMKNLEKLGTVYYSISKEDEETLEKIFKKYL